MRICFIGDELVAGVGDPRGLGWVGRVNAHSTFDLPATFLTLAVPSETTKQIRMVFLSGASCAPGGSAGPR